MEWSRIFAAVMVLKGQLPEEGKRGEGGERGRRKRFRTRCTDEIRERKCGVNEMRMFVLEFMHFFWLDV